MNQKQKTIQTYKQRGVVEVFDKRRSKYAFQRYKHRIKANSLKQAINSVKKIKLKFLVLDAIQERFYLNFSGMKQKKNKYWGIDLNKEGIKVCEQYSSSNFPQRFHFKTINIAEKEWKNMSWKNHVDKLIKI